MILRQLFILLLLATTAPNPAFADEKQDRITAAWAAADKAKISGPTNVTLADQGKLNIPAEMVFVPKAEGNALMKAYGNGDDTGLLGMVVPNANDQNWVLTVDYVGEGHVNDDEAKKWNPTDLLQSLKEGTEASNEERVKQGFAALVVDGWVEPPTYDAAAHKLVWSMRLKHKDGADQDPSTVNYNTYALGRDGYLMLNLLTREDKIEAERPIARQLLAGLQYNQGKRYEDFNASTDHLAEYGIAALIGGVAAKKLGLLALGGVFVLKFIKVIGVAVVVGLAGLKRFFTGRKTPSA